MLIARGLLRERRKVEHHGAYRTPINVIYLGYSRRERWTVGTLAVKDHRPRQRYHRISHHYDHIQEDDITIGIKVNGCQLWMETTHFEDGRKTERS